MAAAAVLWLTNFFDCGLEDDDAAVEEGETRELAGLVLVLRFVTVVVVDGKQAEEGRGLPPPLPPALLRILVLVGGGVTDEAFDAAW